MRIDYEVCEAHPPAAPVHSAASIEYKQASSNWHYTIATYTTLTDTTRTAPVVLLE